MRNSDIFDNYAKIALEKGLFAKATPEELKRKLEENPRMDSLDKSKIESLYNTKLNVPKGMDYKNNIIENAHPKSVIISPSYDKLNGLVENENERQNIIMNIVNKVPNGLLTQRKYAERDLILSLVRVSNYLDNYNKQDLYKLADVCLEQTTNKKITKTAVDPIVTPIVAPIVAGTSLLAGVPIISILIGTAVVIGAIYAYNHLGNINQGFVENHNRLIKEIDDMLDSNTNWGFGYEYKGNFISMLKEFKQKLVSFYEIYKETVPVFEQIDLPRDKTSLIQFVQSKSKVDIVKEAYDKLTKAAMEQLPEILKLSKLFKSEAYKIRNIAEKGLITGWIDKLKFLHGGKAWIPDDFDDVVNALETYNISIGEILKELNNSKSYERKVKEELDSVKSNFEKTYGVSAPGESSTSPQSPQPPSSQSPTLHVKSPKEQLKEDEENLSALLHT